MLGGEKCWSNCFDIVGWEFFAVLGRNENVGSGEFAGSDVCGLTGSKRIVKLWWFSE
jgi:hypothetical protein